MNRKTLETAEVAALSAARLVGKYVPEGWGFTIVLASLEGEPFMTYSSNLEREGSIKMLRELADSIEGKKDI